MENLLNINVSERLEDANPKVKELLEKLPTTMGYCINDFDEESKFADRVDLFFDTICNYPDLNAPQVWEVIKELPAKKIGTLSNYVSKQEKPKTIHKFINDNMPTESNEQLDGTDLKLDEETSDTIRKPVRPTQKAEKEVKQPAEQSGTNNNELTDDQLTIADTIFNNFVDQMPKQQLSELFRAEMSKPEEREKYLADMMAYASAFATNAIQAANKSAEEKTAPATIPTNSQEAGDSNIGINANDQDTIMTNVRPAAQSGLTQAAQAVQQAESTPASPAAQQTGTSPAVQAAEQTGTPTASPAVHQIGTKQVAHNGTNPEDIPVSDNVESLPDIPANVDPRDEYSDVYDEIDRLAISPEQAEEAKNYADTVFNSPDEFERAYAVLTGGSSRERTKCIVGMLSTANRHLGYKNTNSKYNADRMQFDKGTVTQAKNNGSVRNSLIMPSGFGTKKNAAIWNTPVITDFGFPFLNFSSEAMLGVIKSKADDDIKNDNLKKMFKDASKRFGGIWKAIYAAPLALIKQIASDTGVKCTAKYLKINGNDLISAESGENISVVPIKYYSVDAAFDGAVTVPHDFLTTFYDVVDYSTTSKRMYLKYASGMTEQEFVDETNENNGVPPFYLLVPKTTKFSKCQIRSGSLLGSLLNVILGRKKCTMVKTILQGKRGCLAMESHIADTLYAET